MGLIQVPGTQLFTPKGVRTFGALDPALLNSDFSAIAAALNLTTSVVTGDTTLSGANRNVSVRAYSPTTITLPANPTIGDPPCVVGLQYVYYNTSGSGPTNCMITTSDGTSINGIVQTGNTRPSLFTTGDFLEFTYVGGSVGWLSVGRLSAAPGNASPTFGAFPWQGQTVMPNLGGWSGTISLEGIQVSGAFGQVCTFNGVSNVNVGDSTSTFNGSPGPFIINTRNTLYRFTCLGSRSFLVTS